MNTRHGGNLKKEKHKTKIGALSIKIHGPELWNKLDSNLKFITYVKGFKYMYKKLIIPYRSNV